MRFGTYDFDTIARLGGSSIVRDTEEERSTAVMRQRQETVRALRSESEKLAAGIREQRASGESGSPKGTPRLRFRLEYNLLPSQVDDAISRARRTGDVGSRTLAFYLADCADRGIYQEFGHASVIPYAVKRHGISRRRARELITAGRALRELPKIDEAFVEDRLSWSKVRAIARVAEPRTEDSWLEFALAHGVEDVIRECALAKKGESPREDRKGLPEVKFTMSFRMGMLLHEQYLLARQRLGAEMGRDTSDEEFAGALLESFLRRAPEDGRDDSLYRVVLDVRPAAGTASIRSEDGPQPVSAAAAAAICCDAGVLGPDGQRIPGYSSPISAGLRERILARDANRCKVCESRFQLHVHHIVMRSEHGSNAALNLVTVCDRCHTLVHSGFLSIEGAAPHALVYRDRDGRELDAPVNGVMNDRLTLEVDPVPGGAAAPPDSGNCAGIPRAWTDQLPSHVDAEWIAAHRHLIGWDSKRTLIRIEPGQPRTLPDVEGPPELPQGDYDARPATFADVVGQKRVVASLKRAIAGAKARGTMPRPVLLLGQPGLGKTTLARAFARELDARLKVIDGAMLDNVLTLIDHLLNAKDGDVLFVDEIHAIPKRVAEAMYQAIEDGAMDLPFARGNCVKPVRFRLPKIAIIAATTHPELMPEPLVSRFSIREELSPYAPADLAEIIRRVARREKIRVTAAAAQLLARASRGCPRAAIGLYARMKYIVDSQRKPTAGLTEASAALQDAQVDEEGLGPIHRRVLFVLTRHERPMAIGRVARLAGVSTEAFRRFYEPALIELGLITATARGLMASALGQRLAGGEESGT